MGASHSPGVAAGRLLVCFRSDLMVHPGTSRCLQLLLGILLSIVACGTAVAERWQLEPAVGLGSSYDDNVRFTSVDPEGAFSTRLSGALRAIRSTEISELGLALGLAGTRYSGFPDLDNTAGFAGLDWSYRLERQQFRVGARFDSESTLYSEATTTGLTQFNQQQNQVSVNAGWNYQISERAAMDLGASYQDVSYDGGHTVPLSNYHLGVVDLGGSYLWSERLKLTGRVDYGRYETQGVTNDYENLGIQGGAEYQLSETSTLAALVGLRRTRQRFEIGDGISGSSDSSGPTYVLSFAKRFEAGGSLNLGARRELAPSGNSDVLDTIGLLANLSLPLSERLRFGLAASAYRNRGVGIGGDRPSGNRTYASISPSIAYDIDESWRVAASYQFRWQEYDGIPGDAVSNAVFLNLSWTRPWDL
jgi:hypothetical protein